MNKIFSAAALLIAFGASAHTELTDSVATDSIQGFVFTDVISLPTTSVKDQNKSGTCWCFSGTSAIEEEVLRQGGDSLDLSEMYTVRQCYLDKAKRFVRLGGVGNFSQGGSIVDVAYVMERYGAIPESVYSGLNYGEDAHDHSELEKALTSYIKAVAGGRKMSTAWLKGFEGILDAYFGPVPETFEVNGKTYTPKTYAESLGVKFNDFVPFTSFTHQPMYSAFPLEVCDNWLWEDYYNVPLDDFKRIIDEALKNGYTINWAADVSEKGFKWNDGYAVLPEKKTEADMQGTELSRWVALSDADKEKEAYKFTGPKDLKEVTVTPEVRQQMFDNHETTDDHGMVIVGTATDQLGNRFYKVKNSWNTNQKYNGYFYVSEPYLLAKTLSFSVNKNAVPKDIRKKLNLI
ncbi:MAG: aminopeptidase [Muribaculaceae bacterium]|nr:aminopeptidase [Muribaculaceae bacterium]